MQNRAVWQRRPWGLYALVAVLLFMAFGALYGGITFMRDPTGQLMGMPTEWLSRTGFKDYFFPGLILFSVLGVLPLISVFLLWLRTEWGLMQPLENYFHIHWVWGLAFGIGCAQMIWITYQVATMGLTYFLQPLMFVIGLLIVALCLLPSMRRYYAK